jgi:hypothetical protein
MRGLSAQPTREVVRSGSADLAAAGPECELKQIERMLDEHCGICHEEPLFAVPIDCLGGCSMLPVDLAELIEIGKVVPGDAQGSQLLRRIRDNSMPPPSSQLEPLSEQQVAQLEAFIDGLDSDAGARLTCTPSSASDSQ